MYDELVKRLRISGDGGGYSCDECNGECNGVCIFMEAADAIEELSKYADTMRRLKCEGWYLQQSKYHDGYHAVATMPLPQPPEKEQA